MLPNPHTLVEQIHHLHCESVERWHTKELDNPYQELLETICTQHQFNYLRWHEEDIARSTSMGDDRIAAAKRSIDATNQKRNDWIEKIDELLIQLLAANEVSLQENARLNTETPGGVIDRLSILSLRIYHLKEQLGQLGTDNAKREKTQRWLKQYGLQQRDLGQSLAELLADIFAGRKRLQVFRQMKSVDTMPNNPQLHQRAG